MLSGIVVTFSASFEGWFVENNDVSQVYWLHSEQAVEGWFVENDDVIRYSGYIQWKLVKVGL